ncbi:hypothetical protein [Paenibacillus daejeonensis]|uniref:hypothetical protein n=1 Tax=Paenibacillus daejeonensis TaxID=135193 RepID=UPI00036E308F|nr:hypothetical protein [Paenibacillus daejeonensis]
MTPALLPSGCSVIHTLPLFIREDSLQHDLEMVIACLHSLSASAGRHVVIYNQGCLTHTDLARIAKDCGVEAHILGSERNVGIARARQACFEYVWQTYPDVAYISEIHVDMLFPAAWYEPLIRFLDTSQEPMICPGIVTSAGELQPLGLRVPPATDAEQWLNLLASLPLGGLAYGFVHPVIHRSEALQAIGGYDTGLLRGRQGYEDDSLLLGYAYYMGTRNEWKPRCCLQSWVYHATMAQRMSLQGKLQDFALNELGLFHLYGINGLRALARLHNKPNLFDELVLKYMPLTGGREE